MRHSMSRQGEKSRPVTMDRREFLAAAGGGVVGLALPPISLDRGAAGALDASKMNILLIVVEDWSTAGLGCYGNEIVKTPNCDGLAETGVRFTGTPSTPRRVRTSHTPSSYTICKSIRGNRITSSRIRPTRKRRASYPRSLRQASRRPCRPAERPLGLQSDSRQRAAVTRRTGARSRQHCTGSRPTTLSRPKCSFMTISFQYLTRAT